MASDSGSKKDIAAGKDDRNAAALTVVDATATTAVWPGPNQDILDNVRDRVNDLETALQRLGLIP